MLTSDLTSVLYSPEELAKLVKNLAARIDADYEGKEVTLVATLKGAMIVTADLMRQLKKCSPVLDTIAASSYGESTITSGEVKIRKDLDSEIKGKDVVIVEDIVDTGITMHALLPLLRSRGAKSVKLCALFSKPDRRQTEVQIDYLGVEVPDEFLVGYGLDYAGRYRGLPCVGILKREIYS